jgi:hypothetical protein
LDARNNETAAPSAGLPVAGVVAASRTMIVSRAVSEPHPFGLGATNSTPNYRPA